MPQPESRRKVCTKCGVEKSLRYFHRRTMNEDGYDAACKKCRNKKYAPDFNPILNPQSQSNFELCTL